ncbi:MAG: hypothetical protein IKV38_00885 [Clostridia bacterium]|nr:hypothetical protein [Clostridia bacterium]
MKLLETNTLNNLAIAFANECQDGAKYQFLKDKAQQEGYHNIGEICQQHATHEMSHAKIFYDFITDKGKKCVPNVDVNAGFSFKGGTLIETLKLMAGDELTQATVIYPNFAQIASEEGFSDIAKKFELIAEVERQHYLTLEQLFAKLEKDSLYSSNQPLMWRCNSCGHEDTKENAWQICPICNSTQGDIHIPLQF